MNTEGNHNKDFVQLRWRGPKLHARGITEKRKGNNMQAGKFRAGRALAAGFAALSLVVGAGALTATSALAAEAPNFGDIKQNATGSIIIHKGTQPGAATPGSVTGDAPSSFTGLNGVTFTAYPITSLDLSDSADWDTLSTLTVPSTACDVLPPTSVDGQSVGPEAGHATTASGGLATIGSLAVRAYLVCETASPSNVVDKAQPFVVTIPYPDTVSGSTNPTNKWVYDVNVYPKNGVASISKTVTSQANLGLGSTASFPTTTTVPAIAENAQFTHFWIQDPLDPRLTNGNATLSATGLTSDMYTIEQAGTANGNTVTVIFNNDGLVWLKNNPGVTITTTFTGRVSSVGTGTINNKAYLNSDTAVLTAPPETPTPPTTTPGHDNPGNPDNPDNPNNPDYPGTPSNQVSQNWGDLQLFKRDSGDQLTGLDGAKFEIFAAADPYAANCSAATKTGDAIEVNSAKTFTSDDGVVSIAGLFVSDSENAPINEGQRCYVVVETVAPAGYVLDSTPRGVAVKTGATAAGTYDLAINNTKQTVPGLPLTGAAGQLLLVMIGGGLLLVAFGVVLVARRRRPSHEG